MTDQEHEKIKEVVVAIDARLRTLTDSRVKYYLRDEAACVQVTAFMLMPLTNQAGLLQVNVNKLTMAHNMWNAKLAANVFIYSWLEKLQQPRKYEELDVEWNEPPSWVKVVA